MSGHDPSGIRSCAVSVFNFVLLGDRANPCSVDEHSGPFLSYAREDDDFGSLTRRLERKAGPVDWSKCRLAAVVDMKPHFFTKAMGSLSSSHQSSSAAGGVGAAVAAIAGAAAAVGGGEFGDVDESVEMGIDSSGAAERNELASSAVSLNSSVPISIWSFIQSHGNVRRDNTADCQYFLGIQRPSQSGKRAR